MQRVMVNQTVKTPMGQGVVVGTFRAANAPVLDTRALVRLPVNDVTSKHLRDTNCITPRATKSALFTFSNDELNQAVMAGA